MARSVSHRTPSRAPHHLDSAQSEGTAVMDKETRRQSMARSIPSAARQANISHDHASPLHSLRLLGTKYLAPRISLLSSIARGRRTERPPNQRVDFHHAVRHVPVI